MYKYLIKGEKVSLDWKFNHKDTVFYVELGNLICYYPWWRRLFGLRRILKEI